MQFPKFSHPVTGIAISVGSLKTRESCGIGEFLDIIPFADFCDKSHIDMIQLLPVNDTGTESSPYSALSAFALHPIYISLKEIPEASVFAKEITALQKQWDGQSRFNYREIRIAKMKMLRRIFDANATMIADSPTLASWIEQNPWIIEYAVFMNLKQSHFEASWKTWDKMRTPSHTEIRNHWLCPANGVEKSANLFFSWVQMLLDSQFSKAVAYCEKKGIALKGDIPIMMNEDSCDAWANPEFFRDDLRAGNPPDDQNPAGQNWGFPIYNWDNLRADGYLWWKRRLIHTAKYYHAYRIDHILGFFRIWSIPNGNESGCLGWTTPHASVTEEELAERGFSGDRLCWICEPHVPTKLAENANHGDYLGTHGVLQKVMVRVGNEELWRFKREIASERDIRNAQIPEAVKDVLVIEWRNRMMQVTGRDEKGKPLYIPTWKFRDTTAWKSLSWDEQESLSLLIDEKTQLNEQLWKKQAEEILSTLTQTVDMLPCAEDLGTIPDSVPGVLSKLGILGLKVIRWERNWNEQGKPFKRIEDYPELSVATSSVHDSSTLRGWWEQENGANDFMALWNPEKNGYPEGSTDAFRKKYTAEVASFVIKTMARSSSRILILPVQDILSLSPDYYEKNADDERINIPGSVTPFNWTYRLPAFIDELEKNNQLISSIHETLKERRSKTQHVTTTKGAS